MDAVVLRGLRAVGHHGAAPGEQDRAQPFEVDLELVLDLARAGRSDDLADTVDYGTVVDAVAAVVSGERHALLERLAERAAEVVLADPRVCSVTVEVRKLRPPVPADLGSAGVRVTRSRPVASRAGGRTFVALGSNQGDRWGHLRAAVAGLPDVVGVSAVYETDPVGGPPGQPPYLNAVVELGTALSPRQLLVRGQALEAAAGRTPGERWGPRPLDVDVLLVGPTEVAEADLVVPHPRWRDRPFVLVPLHDLAPDLVPDPPRGGGVRRAGTIDHM